MSSVGSRVELCCWSCFWVCGHFSRVSKEKWRHTTNRHPPVAFVSLDEDACVQIFLVLSLGNLCWALAALSFGKGGSWDMWYRRMRPGLDGNFPSSPFCPVTRNSCFSKERWSRVRHSVSRQRMFLVMLFAVRGQWWRHWERKMGCGSNFMARKLQSVASHDGKVIPCYQIPFKVEQDRRGTTVEEPQKWRSYLEGTGLARSPAALMVPQAGTSVSDGLLTFWWHLCHQSLSHTICEYNLLFQSLQNLIKLVDQSCLFMLNFFFFFGPFICAYFFILIYLMCLKKDPAWKRVSQSPIPGWGSGISS